MNAKDVSPQWLKERLQALSAVEPPEGLRQRLLAALPGRPAREATPWYAHGGLGARVWAGIVATAATVVVVCGVAWLRVPTPPAGQPLADANGGLNRVMVADFNAVRPADINALDSNGL